jgi:polar amino acid transport system substrate-binding protein
MSLRRRSLTLTLLGAGAGAAPARGAAPLRLVAEVDPPYVLPGHEPLGAGIDIDIARQALALGQGPDFRVQLLPFRRALILLENGQADLTLGLGITPERERYLAFSQPYGGEVRHQFISATGSRVRVRALDDLRSLRVGLVRGYAYPEGVMRTIGQPASWASSKSALLRMVVAQRIDVAVMEAQAARWVAGELGLQAALQAQPFEIRSASGAHFAFSRASPAAMAARAAMDRGLALMAAAAPHRRRP